ncbi:tol protein [Colletotrichum chrysophilum]|uniref:Tol protein n=1 Tax=Colletotrichum chrysophilum TaxID=1836956 RepID=A0AAD9ACE1_9PEZI|nr:tol protein [Colletotrichum chrysophilum]
MRYACLSHCWGNPAEIGRTLKENIEDHKNSVPLNALTTTFQNAVETCRFLGIKYIWIDSICIIQNSDSQEDWVSEAARMADIYENAYITIAATKSTASSGGCYSETPKQYIARPIPGYQNAFSRFKLPGLPTHWYDFGRQKELPLLNWGWVYQEMRLSHRVLHFCAQEVIWDCRSGTLRQKESESNEHPRSRSTPEHVHYNDMPYHIPSKRPDLLWYRLVSEYSNLRLTKTDEDRMAALAGIVKSIQHHHQRGKYLIGLWENSLILDLCWETAFNAYLESRWKSRYPSWSWASVHNQVSWDNGVNKAYVPLSTIEGINVVYDGPDNLGKASEFSMSSITIKAPILKCKVAYASDAEGKPQVVLTEAKGIVARGYTPDFIMPRTRRRTGFVAVLCGKTTAVCMALHLQKRRKRGADVYERMGHVWIEQERFVGNYSSRPSLSGEGIKKFWSILPEPSVIELV